MVAPIANTALTGLQAASKRLANSADNIANIQSTFSQVNGETVPEPFRPKDVQQSSLETGGVRTELRERNPATVSVYDPSNGAADANGVTQFPNVNLEEEVIQQKFASYDYKANLKVIEIADEVLKSTLDILA